LLISRERTSRCHRGFALKLHARLLAGLLLKWKPLAAVRLGGVTYVSSQRDAKVWQNSAGSTIRDSGRAVDLGAGGLDHGRLFASRAVLLAGGSPVRMVLSALIGTGYSPSGSRSGCLLRRAAEPRCRSSVR